MLCNYRWNQSCRTIAFLAVLAALVAVHGFWFGFPGVRAQAAEPSDRPSPSNLVQSDRLSDAPEIDGLREPSVVLQPVDWNATLDHHWIDDAVLPESVRFQLEFLDLPVLLPSEPGLLGQAILTPGLHGYAVSIPAEGVTIYIRGSRQAFVITDLAQELGEELSSTYYLTRNTGIVSLSFVAFNVGYLIEVECAEPDGDPRCLEDDFILSLFERLAVAGGAP